MYLPLCEVADTPFHIQGSRGRCLSILTVVTRGNEKIMLFLFIYFTEFFV